MRTGSLLLILLLLLVITPVYVSIPTVKGESNLIVNGTFDSDLTGTWAIYRVSIAKPYPIVRREREADGNYYLYFDTPYPTEAYVQQGPINIPRASKVLLSFKEWGWNQPAQISVEVIGQTGNTSTIDDFYTEGLTQLNGARITKTYDLTEFAGQSIYLRFNVSSPYNSGTITGIDDVRLVVGDPLQPFIACGVTPQEPTTLPENSVQSGQNVSVSGETYPAVQMPLTTVYTSPDGTVTTQEIVPSTDGSFNEDFTPIGAGIWYVSISPAQFAGTEYAGSCNSQFVVRGPVEIDPLQIVVNGRAINISSPVIQVKPEELISGTITVRTLDNLRFANLVVLGFDTWQPNEWDLVMYGQGCEGDPSGLGWKYGLVPEPPGYNAATPACGAGMFIVSDSNILLVPRDRHLGSYVFNVTWTFPLSADVGNEVHPNGFYLLVPHPSMIAPSAPGEYYLVLIQAWVNSASELVRDTNAFTRTNWQRLVPPSRNATNILAIPVLVVDVDSHLNAANQEISCANDYNANTSIAEGYYSQALELASEGYYNASASMADEALTAATVSVGIFQGDIKSNIVWFLYWISQNLVSIGNRNRIALDYDKFDSLMGGREYCQARQLQDDITTLAGSDIVIFVLYFLFLLFAIGDLAAHLVEKKDPARFVEKKINKVLGKKLKPVQGPLAGFATYGLITLLASLASAPFPTGGLLVLTGGVGLGWGLNKTEKPARYLWNGLKRKREKIRRKASSNKKHRITNSSRKSKLHPS